MKKKPFTEERIIAVLKGHEFGATAADFSRKHGISPQTPCGFAESGNFRNSLVRWFVRWFLKETMSSA